VLSQRSTPVKMTQEAANKLPRWSLLALLTLFAFCGFWATGLWTLRDALSFGTAMSMLDGSFSSWLMPVIADAPVTDAGPMTGWLTASLIAISRWTGLMGDIAATRFAACLLFALTTAALWYGTWHLARRPEAQPIAFAFGGEACPRDYGRVVADSAVLLFVSTFGILTRQHEALPDTALLTMGALVFYGLTFGLRRPLLGAFIAGVASGAAIVSTTLFAGCWLLVLALVTIQLLRGFKVHRRQRLMLACIGALVGFLPWPLLSFLLYPQEASVWFGEWLPTQLSHFSFAGIDTYLWFTKNALWYLCPIWPFVIWAIYAWRHQIRQTHILLPFGALLAGIPAVIFSSFQAYDTVFLVFLPTLAVLAAFGLVTIRRGYENILDWFSLNIFTLGTVVLWAYWFAWLTNFAPKMAASLQRLAPGTTPVFDGGFTLALISSLIWLIFIGWRLTHRPVVIWRGPWLSAAGITAFSATLIGLYHTAIDLNRSYVPVVEAVATELKVKGLTPEDCVAGVGFNHGLQALFKHYADLQVLTREGSQRCRFEIIRSRGDHNGFSRPHTDETFTVYQR